VKIKPDNRKFSRLYRRFLYRFAGGVVLLLTTTGRRSGRPHTVGLQYELIDGVYWVGAADGERADWYRNVEADPRVVIQVGENKINATVELVADPERVVRFLAYRLKKRPLMLRLILRLDGISGRITDQVLRDYARNIRAAVITPSNPR